MSLLPIHRDIGYLNKLLKKNRVEIDASLALCRSLTSENKKNKLAICHVEHMASCICYAPALLKRNRSTRLGILSHEIGHLSLLKRGDIDHAEHEADREAERILGVKIEYDKHGLQVIKTKKRTRK